MRLGWRGNAETADVSASPTLRSLAALALLAVPTIAVAPAAAAVATSTRPATAQRAHPVGRVQASSRRRRTGRRHVRQAQRRHARHHRHRTGATSAPIAVTATAGGITYYVSPSGSDSNSGTSPSQAWQTVKQVDRANLKPGDVVLFQGGATFTDDPLMPGWGTDASGTSTAPITFGSYGQGRAALPLGIWFNGDDNLVFANLALGASSGDSSTGGFQGTGDGITIEGLQISHVGLGVLSEGNNWRIVDNTISYTGDSGMLLGFNAGTPGDPPGGSGYLVSQNTITETGLNPALTFGTHGIYLKVADSTVTDNTITHFNNDGISVRYRNNTITGNTISGGEIGLAWFQYDNQSGTSDWSNNTLSDLSTVGMFVCGTQEGCRRPLESFHIAGNTIHGAPLGMNLQPINGTYSVGGNSLP